PQLFLFFLPYFKLLFRATFLCCFFCLLCFFRRFIFFCFFFLRHLNIFLFLLGLILFFRTFFLSITSFPRLPFFLTVRFFIAFKIRFRVFFLFLNAFKNKILTTKVTIFN